MENTEQKTCQVEMHDDKQCGRPLYDGEKCICHSKKEDKDVELFQKELDKIFSDDEAAYYDMTCFIFPKDGYKLPMNYKKDTYCYEATFLGKADFEGATFSGDADFFYATFSGDADFSDAKFSGKAYFFEAKFLGKANFFTTTFLGEADFRAVKFSGETHFSEAMFSGDAEFGSAAFSGDAIFWKLTFSGEARFGEATFSGEANFRMTMFSEYANFIRAKFLREANFNGAMFSGFTWFRLTRFEKRVIFHCQVSKDAVVTFNGEKLGEEKEEMFPDGADFSSCIFAQPKNIMFRKLSLEKCEFLETDVTEVQFVDVAWASKPKFFKWFRRQAVCDEFSRKPDYKLIAQLYRRLQKNYIDNFQYAEAGDFYIGEQEMVRKAKGSGWKVWRRIFCTNFLYKYISYYGESFLLPLFWLAFVLLLLPAVLLYDGINLNPTLQDPAVVETVNYEWSWSPGDFLPVSGDSRRDYWEAFVANFSVIAYSRSDIGKYLPESGTRFIVTIESLIVIALLAFFLLALRRQYKRKTF